MIFGEPEVACLRYSDLISRKILTKMEHETNLMFVKKKILLRKIENTILDDLLLSLTHPRKATFFY